MTYREARNQAEVMLQRAGIEEYAADAARLLFELMDWNMTSYLLQTDSDMPEEKERAYRQWIDRRAQRIPLQHITGHQEFMGFDFAVGPGALIPRQDTEELVESALSFLRKKQKESEGALEGRSLRVADVCTGTGCIAISIAKLCTQAEVLASDLSKEALAIARENVKRLSAAAALFEGDLLEPLDGTFDLIVSNPPYIPEAEIAALDPEVKDHDPHLALSGGGDGLCIYRRLIPNARAKLKRGGALMMEIGYDQAEAVKGLMEEAGFQNVFVKQDLSGKDRVIGGTYV